jgi:hypothetical protein
MRYYLDHPTLHSLNLTLSKEAKNLVREAVAVQGACGAFTDDLYGRLVVALKDIDISLFVARHK